MKVLLKAIRKSRNVKDKFTRGAGFPNRFLRLLINFILGGRGELRGLTQGASMITREILGRVEDCGGGRIARRGASRVHNRLRRCRDRFDCHVAYGLEKITYSSAYDMGGPQ